MGTTARASHATYRGAFPLQQVLPTYPLPVPTCVLNLVWFGTYHPWSPGCLKCEHVEAPRDVIETPQDDRIRLHGHMQPFTIDWHLTNCLL